MNEEDGAFIQVCVNITEGELARDASVTLQTTDGTATCKSQKMHWSIWRCIIMSIVPYEPYKKPAFDTK